MWSRVFVSILIYPLYEYNHVNRCDDVEHGRNHLIIDRWCKPLIGARETTNNDDDPQGTTTQSTSENEWAELEHLQNLSVDIQWGEPIVDHEELSIEAWNLQGTTKEFLDQLPR